MRRRRGPLKKTTVVADWTNIVSDLLLVDQPDCFSCQFQPGGIGSSSPFKHRHIFICTYIYTISLSISLYIFFFKNFLYGKHV